MACRLHAGDYSSFAVFLRHVLHPCFECLESGLCVAELQRFLCILIVAPVKCSGIMSLTSDINTNDQSFFSYGAIFAFCVLQFILDTSLFNKIFTNRPKSVILFYSEVFFFNLLSWNFLYLNYTGSSCYILFSKKL